MKGRNTIRIVAGACISLGLMSCAGILSFPMSGANPSVSPSSATVPPNGKVNISIWESELSAYNHFYTVDGGDSSGTIVKDPSYDNLAVYTAPATPGIYTVRAGFSYNPGKLFTGIVKIKVQ